jgi:pyruvate kinase
VATNTLTVRSTSISPAMIMQEQPMTRKTKIVCTMVRAVHDECSCEKAPGFNPLNRYKVTSWFQSLLSQMGQLVCRYAAGPKCWDEANMAALIDAGMGVARFNFSHGGAVQVHP